MKLLARAPDQHEKAGQLYVTGAVLAFHRGRQAHNVLVGEGKTQIAHT